jgi:hypothetical protein
VPTVSDAMRVHRAAVCLCRCTRLETSDAVASVIEREYANLCRKFVAVETVTASLGIVGIPFSYVSPPLLHLR